MFYVVTILHLKVCFWGSDNSQTEESPGRIYDTSPDSARALTTEYSTVNRNEDKDYSLNHESQLEKIKLFSNDSEDIKIINHYIDNNIKILIPLSQCNVTTHQLDLTNKDLKLNEFANDVFNIFDSIQFSSLTDIHSLNVDIYSNSDKDTELFALKFKLSLLSCHIVKMIDFLSPSMKQRLYNYIIKISPKLSNIKLHEDVEMSDFMLYLWLLSIVTEKEIDTIINKTIEEKLDSEILKILYGLKLYSNIPVTVTKQTIKTQNNETENIEVTQDTNAEISKIFTQNNTLLSKKQNRLVRIFSAMNFAKNRNLIPWMNLSVVTMKNMNVIYLYFNKEGMNISMKKEQIESPQKELSIEISTNK